MEPLPAHTVQLVLQYISSLSIPLPPHLISTPLHQRHHFLHISPDSPVEYLCWPSPDNAKIINLLDHLPTLSDHTSFTTRYTSDSESTFAHVQVSSDAQGLRMLFHWDDNHGWKYHDLRLMPFPSSSFLTPRESLASTSDSPSVLSLEDDHFNSCDDNSYWDAYGAVEHDPTSSLPPQSTTDAVEGEDAYWAQYASVQGSADSTIPSPLPTHRRLRPANSTDDGFPSQNGPVVDIPADAIQARRLPSRLAPPSPSTLAHLLSAISPRKDIFSPVRDYTDSLQSPSAHSTVLSPEQTAVDSALVTPPMPDGSFDASIASPLSFKLNGAPLPDCPSRPQTEDTALTDSIKGLYYLWKAGRKGEPEEKDTTVFLRIVQAAIAYE